MLETIDAAVLSSLAQLTVSNVRDKMETEQAEVNGSTERLIEERISEVMLGRASPHLMPLFARPMFNRMKWGPVADFMLFVLAKKTGNADDISVEVEKRRHFFDFACPFQVIMSQITKKRGELVKRAPSVVKALVIKFAQLERGAIGHVFSPEEVEAAGVDPKTMEMWQTSLIMKGPAEPEQHRVLHSNMAVMKEIVERIDPLLQPKTATLAALVMKTGVCTVAKKQYVIGRDDECDLKLPEAEFDDDTRFVLMLKSDLWFYCENIGRVEICVNGVAVGTGKTVYVPSDGVIRVGSCVMMLKYNMWMIERLRLTMERARPT